MHDCKGGLVGVKLKCIHVGGRNFVMAQYVKDQASKNMVARVSYNDGLQ